MQMNIYAYQVEIKKKTLMDLSPKSATPILILYLKINNIFSALDTWYLNRKLRSRQYDNIGLFKQ